jgi:hypothetical protein
MGFPLLIVGAFVFAPLLPKKLADYAGDYTKTTSSFRAPNDGLKHIAGATRKHFHFGTFAD